MRRLGAWMVVSHMRCLCWHTSLGALSLYGLIGQHLVDSHRQWPGEGRGWGWGEGMGMGLRGHAVVEDKGGCEGLGDEMK